MRPLFGILIRVFIRPFYRENAALFMFIFTMMFCIVNKVDGADVFQYHYSLIKGMLKSPVFLIIVFAVWLLYCRKYMAFISDTARKPENNFLELLNRVSIHQRQKAYLLTVLLLSMPALLYALPVIVIGFVKQYYWAALITAVFWLILIGAMVAILFRVFNPLKHYHVQLDTISMELPVNYPGILLRCMKHNVLILLLSIKVVTGVLVLLIISNNVITAADIGSVYLLYTFCVFANGIVFYRLRTFEAQYLGFYRALPVSTTTRLLQYAFICFVCLLPEVIVILLANTSHFPVLYKAGFLLCGYGIMLFMNSVSFIRDFNIKEFLGILMIAFVIQYIFLLTFGLFTVSVAFIFAAIFIFYRFYGSFEKPGI